jgi:predicted nuclease of predicted toxin-antitoxin system
MKLLANENIPLASVRILEDKGFDVLSIGRDHAGIQDAEVMQLSIDQARTIITFDRDYGELIFKKGFRPMAGVIYLRWEGFLPHEPGAYLCELLVSKNIQFENRLTVVGEHSIRQRKY